MSIQLPTYIQAAFQTSPSEAEQIIRFFKPLQLEKGDYFIKENQFPPYLGFIQSGLLREYFNHDGREITKWIGWEGYFVTDLAGFLFEKPARVNIQALTDCMVFTLNKTDYAALKRTVPRWTEIENAFLARCFTLLEDRVMTHLSLSAEARFEAFFQYKPELFHQVPYHYLASMLGMTPETFSRIRKKRSLRSS